MVIIYVICLLIIIFSTYFFLCDLTYHYGDLSFHHYGIKDNHKIYWNKCSNKNELVIGQDIYGNNYEQLTFSKNVFHKGVIASILTDRLQFAHHFNNIKADPRYVIFEIADIKPTTKNEKLFFKIEKNQLTLFTNASDYKINIKLLDDDFKEIKLKKHDLD